MSQDKYDEMAAKLIDHCRFCDRLGEGYKCDTDYAENIETVAAELKKQGERIEKLEAALKAFLVAPSGKPICACVSVNKVRAGIDRPCAYCVARAVVEDK